MSENKNQNAVETQEVITPSTAAETNKSVELKLSIPKPDKNMIDKIKKGAMGLAAVGTLAFGSTHFGKGVESKAVDFDKQVETMEVQKAEVQSHIKEGMGESESKFYQKQVDDIDAKIKGVKDSKDEVFSAKMEEGMTLDQRFELYSDYTKEMKPKIAEIDEMNQPGVSRSQLEGNESFNRATKAIVEGHLKKNNLIIHALQKESIDSLISKSSGEMNKVLLELKADAKNRNKSEIDELEWRNTINKSELKKADKFLSTLN